MSNFDKYLIDGRMLRSLPGSDRDYTAYYVDFDCTGYYVGYATTDQLHGWVSQKTWTPEVVGELLGQLIVDGDFEILRRVISLIEYGHMHKDEKTY